MLQSARVTFDIKIRNFDSVNTNIDEDDFIRLF